MKTMKTIEALLQEISESSGETREQALQALISEDKNINNAYYLAAKNKQMEVLTYLEEKLPRKLQNMVESVFWTILYDAAKNMDCDMIQHFLPIPVAREFLSSYAIGRIEEPTGGNKTMSEKFFVPSQTFLKQQLNDFYDKKIKQDGNPKIQYIARLNKYLINIDTTAIKNSEVIVTQIQIIQAKLFQLLASYEDKKILLKDLKIKSQNLFNNSHKFYPDDTATESFCDQILTALRAFFHACDSLQAIFTGEMIDKPDRQKFFSKPANEIQIEEIKDIAQKFMAEIDNLEKEIKPSDQTGDVPYHP